MTRNRSVLEDTRASSERRRWVSARRLAGVVALFMAGTLVGRPPVFACELDGVVGPGEECDDGNDNDVDCCRNDCTANVGAPCGPGITCGADRCNAAGTCERVAANRGVVCGPASSTCDPPPRCDGSGTGCPAAKTDKSLCAWSIKPAGDPLREGISALCSVPDNLGTSSGGTRRSDCVCVGKEQGGGKRLTARVAPRLVDKTESPDGPRKEKRFFLRLNARGRRLLKQGGTLTVEVNAVIHHGDTEKGSERSPLKKLIMLLLRSR